MSDECVLPVITPHAVGSEPDMTTEHTPWFESKNASIRLEITEARVVSFYTSCHDLSFTKDRKIRSISDCEDDTPMLSEPPGKSMINSCHELNTRKTDRPTTKHKHRTRSTIIKDLANPLNRQDIFYSGSIINLPEYQSQSDLRSYIASTTNLPTTSDPHTTAPPTWCGMGTIKHTLSTVCSSVVFLFDFAVFTNCYFIILCFASVFIQLAYFIPYIFLPDYALYVGIKAEYSAFIFSILGMYQNNKNITDYFEI